MESRGIDSSSSSGGTGGLKFISRDVLNENEEEQVAVDDGEEDIHERDQSLQMMPSHGPYLHYDGKDVTLYD